MSRQKINTVNGQVADTIHNHGDNYFGCQPMQQHQQQALEQEEFKKLTGIWCPVAAHAQIQALREKSLSRDDVWLAWRLGYIHWNTANNQLQPSSKWLFFMLGVFMALGLLWSVKEFAMLFSNFHEQWQLMHFYSCLQVLFFLYAFDTMVFRPRKVVRTLENGRPTVPDEQI